MVKTEKVIYPYNMYKLEKLTTTQTQNGQQNAALIIQLGNFMVEILRW